MITSFIHLLALLGTSVNAFPALMNGASAPTSTKKLDLRSDPLGISAAEQNCGPIDCLTFDPVAQLVSTTGSYAYASPAADEIRGPCPGLNAASNHGYLPRSGIVSLTEAVQGLSALYGMSPDVSAFLSAYAIAITGDVVTQTWSIGGPLPANILTSSGLLANPQGISWSHNKYEGDTSIGRNDAYLNNGDAHSLNVTRFGYAYATGLDNDRYTLDKFRQDIQVNQERSVQNNPYYFAPVFSTTAVVPAAYNLVINHMSNHSAAEPNGYLNGDMFKQFFAISGDYPNFTWLPGQERIPENWYRRPLSNQYNLVNIFQDLAIMFAAYPSTLRLGGNTGTTNSYVGVDPSNLTGGTFSAASLLEGNNFACFVFQTEQQALPDELMSLTNDVAGALALINKYGGSSIISQLGCPPLAGYDGTLFNQFPGRNYSPTGPATNY